MPTVLREAGFDFRIYLDDHQPSHVHVVKAGREAVINLGSKTTRPVLRINYGMSRQDLRKAFRVVNDNQQYFLQEWRRIHG